MRDHPKIPILLAAILFMIATSGCALTQKTKQVKPLRITGGEEILVAKDTSAMRPFWCGDKPILVYQPVQWGVYFYDLNTRKNIKVAEPGNIPVTCTHDGQWLIYKNNKSYRFDKDAPEETIIDLWRYEFKTGKTQKFFVVDTNDIGNAILIPFTLKMYLSRKSNQTIEMPEPKWDITWSSNNQSVSAWLKDGSVAIDSHVDFSQPPKNRKQIMDVEVFYPRRKSFTITPYFYHFYPLLSDNQNRFYIRAGDGNYENHLDDLKRCRINIKKEKMSCETLFSPWQNYWDFDVFPDGENIVFSKTGYNCVKAKMIGKDNTHCITSKHITGSSIKISPNGRWLAFKKGDPIETEYSAEALYIIRIHITEETE